MSPQKLAISKEPLIMVPEIDASFDQNIRHVINLLVSNEFFDSNVQITPGMAHVINSLMSSHVLEVLLPNGQTSIYPEHLRNSIERILARTMLFKTIFINRINNEMIQKRHEEFLQHEIEIFSTINVGSKPSLYRKRMVYFVENNFNMFFMMVLCNIVKNEGMIRPYHYISRTKIRECYKQIADYFNRGVFCTNTFGLMELHFNDIMQKVVYKPPQSSIRRTVTRFDAILVDLCDRVRYDLTTKLSRHSAVFTFENVHNDLTKQIWNTYKDLDPILIAFTYICNTIYNNLSDPRTKVRLNYFFNVCAYVGIDVWEYDKYIDSFHNNGYDDYLTTECYSTELSLVSKVGFIMYGDMVLAILKKELDSITEVSNGQYIITLDYDRDYLTWFVYIKTVLQEAVALIIDKLIDTHSGSDITLFNVDIEYSQKIASIKSLLYYIAEKATDTLYEQYLEVSDESESLTNIEQGEIVLRRMNATIISGHDQFDIYFQDYDESNERTNKIQGMVDIHQQIRDLSEIIQDTPIQEFTTPEELVKYNPVYSIRVLTDLYDNENSNQIE